MVVKWIIVAGRYEALLGEIRREFPHFRVIRKDMAPTQRLIHQLLRVLTFGSQTRYLTDYQTTIGQTVYVTADWDDGSDADRYITMRHERVHLRQFRRYTLPGMAFLYLLAPLPVGLSWFRAHFEKQGYAETIIAAAEIHGIAHVKAPGFREHVVSQFVSGAYGWMWPFRRSVERWYDHTISRLERTTT